MLLLLTVAEESNPIWMGEYNPPLSRQTSAIVYSGIGVVVLMRLLQQLDSQPSSGKFYLVGEAKSRDSGAACVRAAREMVTRLGIVRAGYDGP
jgi:hypothetical protein